MNIRILVFVLLLFVFGVWFSFRSSNVEKKDSVLVVGMMSGWAPFMSINGAGEYEGFDVDVAKEVAQRMGKQLIIEDLGSLPPCFIALDQQKIDMVFSGLDITQTRLEKMGMVRYTGEDISQYALLFWNEVPADIQSISDIQKFPQAVVSVESGSSQEKLLNSYDFVTKKCMNSVTDIVLDIRFGKSFTGLVESRVAARLARQNAQIKRVVIELPQDFYVYGCGIAIKKENTVLINDTTMIVNQMYQDGTLKKLEQKWQLEE